jgi:hypothetical protein
MNRIRLVVVVGSMVVALAATSPALAVPPASQQGEWHRNNYNAGEEILTCREGARSWTCTYRIPDGTGWFSGEGVTDSWTCPGWFPSAICDNVVAVYHGRFLFVPDGGATEGPPVLVSQDYVITEVDGRAVLQLYWVGQFVCPWYRTHEEAFAADFNCVFGS